MFLYSLSNRMSYYWEDGRIPTFVHCKGRYFFHIPTNEDKKIRYLDFIKIILHAISRHQLRYIYDDNIDIAYIGAVPPWTE